MAGIQGFIFGRFHNKGDAIAEVPLKEWGYGRYGISLDLAADQDNLTNFRQRFQSVMGETYGGILSTDSFASTLKILANTKEEFHTMENQFLFDMAGCILGEFTLENFVKIAVKRHMKIAFVKTLYNVMKDSMLSSWELAFNSNFEENVAFLTRIDVALENTSGLSEEEFARWVSSGGNRSLVNEIKETLDITMKVRADLIGARDAQKSIMDQLSSTASNVEIVYHLFYSTDGKLKDPIFHGHQQETYVLWINFMYYGYAGWKDNGELLKVKIAGAHNSSVGVDCFYGCTKLEEAVIGDTVKELE